MKKMFFALTMWLTLTLLIIGSSTRAAAQATPTPSPADLRAMEQQILVEVNKIRTNPAALAAALTTMKQTSQPSERGSVEVTLPDSTTTTVGVTYLDSAIAKAQTLQPMGTLVWSPGLAQAALNYANSDPEGHNDGSTLQSRLAAVGAYGAGGAAESINYGGSTALLQTYELYIDSGVPSLGHRMMMIDPKLTHLGVGCYYPNQKYNNITCVLNYAGNWVEKSDEVKHEIGKQYAFREEKGKFRYFVLTNTTGRPLPYQISLCPKDPVYGYGGSINLSDLADLTTVANAAAENLVATNQPCSTNDAPQGVLNNGTAFPVAGSAAPGSAQAPAAPAAAQAPAAPSAAQGPPPAPMVKDGEQFAVIQTPNSTFAYFKVKGLRVRGTIGPNTPIPVTRCPEMTSTGTTYLEDMMSVEVALARGLTATNEPCPNTPNGQ